MMELEPTTFYMAMGERPLATRTERGSSSRDRRQTRRSHNLAKVSTPAMGPAASAGREEADTCRR